MKILVWGGTIEGRQLAEYLCGTDAEVHICVATGYGKDLLPEAENIVPHAGRLDAEEMAALLEQVQPALGIDATHPYAVDVSENIRKACGEKQVPYLRVKRNEAELTDGSKDAVLVSDTEEAVAFLRNTEGNVFLTTGSKELKTFAKLPHFEERLIARVLSSAEVVQMCRDLGFPGRHIIAAQGPFGEEINYAMLKEYKAAWMVTKNTGDAGGFRAKWDAAVRAGVKIVVIGRPEEKAADAMTLEEAEQYLAEKYQLTGPGERRLDAAVQNKDLKNGAGGVVEGKRVVSLVGIGPGSKELMTGEAVRTIEESDLLIGAQRMLDAYPQDKPFYNAYRKEEIAAYIGSHPEYRRIAILLSGDIGYFSGAKGLAAVLREKGNLELKFVPGIASPIYFMDRLGISWDDCIFTSMHGQQVNLVEMIRRNPKVCTLLGSKTDVSDICKKLERLGLSHVRVTVGSRFSYPEEAFRSGTVTDFIGSEITSLSVALFENEKPERKTGGFGVPDDAFIRGKVPMTKEEIRSVSISKLRLCRDSVVYDVGAGTGSVTVEMAGFCTEGKVFAIETNPEAVELIRQNAEKFGVDNVEIVPGMAPDCMQDLPAPTHVFLGGTKGNLKEIVELVRGKNPEARFVMNVITPESLAQALEFGGEIVQMQISRGRAAGKYHLMTAENPVYIITF